MKRCPQCNSHLTKPSQFCSECGTPLRSESSRIYRSVDFSQGKSTDISWQPSTSQEKSTGTSYWQPHSRSEQREPVAPSYGKKVRQNRTGTSRQFEQVGSPRGRKTSLSQVRPDSHGFLTRFFDKLCQKYAGFEGTVENFNPDPSQQVTRELITPSGEKQTVTTIWKKWTFLVVSFDAQGNPYPPINIEMNSPDFKGGMIRDGQTVFIPYVRKQSIEAKRIYNLTTESLVIAERSSLLGKWIKALAGFLLVDVFIVSFVYALLSASPVLADLWLLLAGSVSVSIVGGGIRLWRGIQRLRPRFRSSR